MMEGIKSADVMIAMHNIERTSKNTENTFSKLGHIRSELKDINSRLKESEKSNQYIRDRLDTIGHHTHDIDHNLFISSHVFKWTQGGIWILVLINLIELFW